MAGEKRRHPPIRVIVIVLVLLIGGGAWWWWSSTQTSTASGQWQVTGSVEATNYQVAAALSGRVTAVHVAEGDQVTKGQELIRLDGSATKLVVDQANQGVTAAKAALTNAKDDSGSTKADITAARARLKQAEAAVKLAKVQLGYTVVTAPRDGTVVSVTTNTGQNAGPGKTLLTMIDPTDLFVRVFVPETEIGKVKIGQASTLVTDSSTTTYQGTVSFIASQSEFAPNTVQTKDQRVKLVFEVRVRITDPSGSLKAGMPVDITFS
ncbi:MAG: efflux RND transporter periplasmic adaptor subunit [Propionibacteriaceae bacterium]|nr:efflux RND transporter periplasmic adaptor subunit [Propionibacteriaceae bacterium]